jgi:hypothetical protein
VTSLAFESPMMGLEKVIFKRGQKKWHSPSNMIYTHIEYTDMNTICLNLQVRLILYPKNHLTFFSESNLIKHCRYGPWVISLRLDFRRNCLPCISKNSQNYKFHGKSKLLTIKLLVV